jgi:hypothetical protein
MWIGGAIRPWQAHAIVQGSLTLQLRWLQTPQTNTLRLPSRAKYPASVCAYAYGGLRDLTEMTVPVKPDRILGTLLNKAESQRDTGTPIDQNLGGVAEQVDPDTYA